MPNSKVGDISRELPHYYCNAHNPDPNSYPVEPGKDVTIVEPIAPPPKDDEDDEDSDKEDGGGTISDLISGGSSTKPKS